MTRFDRFHITDLKNCLYYSNIHDAIIEGFEYDRAGKRLTIEAVNPIHDVGIDFVFVDVKVLLSISGSELGSCETVLSLTVEEDYSCLKNCMQVCDDSVGDSLYLLFQMFNGDEIHIVSSEVLVEIKR